MRMLAEYRRWLESELKTLGNASHHAYSFGQANMAKRAIERFDKDTAGVLLVGVDRQTAAQAIDALAAQSATPNEPLMKLREALQASLQEAGD